MCIRDRYGSACASSGSRRHSEGTREPQGPHACSKTCPTGRGRVGPSRRGLSGFGKRDPGALSLGRGTCSVLRPNAPLGETLHRKCSRRMPVEGGGLSYPSRARRICREQAMPPRRTEASSKVSVDSRRRSTQVGEESSLSLSVDLGRRPHHSSNLY